MIRATTPTFTLTVGGSEVDFSTAQNIYVTITNSQRKLTLTGGNLRTDGNVISCYLTQEQSLQLSEGTAKIQVNWTYLGTQNEVMRAATKVATITITEQLLKEVIE